MCVYSFIHSVECADDIMRFQTFVLLLKSGEKINTSQAATPNRKGKRRRRGGEVEKTFFWFIAFWMRRRLQFLPPALPELRVVLGEQSENWHTHTHTQKKTKSPK